MSYNYFYGQSGELFSYFRIPKALFQDCRFRQLSTDARTLYGILLDRMSLSVKNGWLDEQGRVYIIYTVREVQESLCCAEHKAVKLFRELEGIDLIERKRRGLGRPSLIYVKDFSSGLPKAQVQNCPNSNSGAAESAILVQPKPQANKTDKNKTEWNDPDPIYGIRAPWKIYCIRSAYYIYKSYGTALYHEMLSVLVDAWGGDSDSFLSGILHGMARFLALYQGEYSRERLILRLRTVHPKTITRLAQNDTGNVADRHMKQILSIYNGAGRAHSLPCKR